jgi:hypothetical protein
MPCSGANIPVFGESFSEIPIGMLPEKYTEVPFVGLFMTPYTKKVVSGYIVRGFKKLRELIQRKNHVAGQHTGPLTHYIVPLDEIVPTYGVFRLTFTGAVFYLPQASIERSVDLQQRRKGL